MATLVRLAQCTVTMYPGDHLPPQSHVRYADGREALVSLDTETVLSGSVTRRELSPALTWAADRLPFLQSKWKALNP